LSALLIDIFAESPGLPLLDIHAVVDALTKLRLLEKSIDVLYQSFDSIILSPRLNLAADRTTAAILVSGDDIQVVGRNPDISVQHLFKDLNVIIEYLSTRLPPSVSTPLSQILLPGLIPRLISTWLSSSVPPSLEGMQEYREMLALAVKLEEDIETVGWTANGELLDWVNQAPRVWLTRRREASLDSVRSILSRDFGKTKSVERVETQTVMRKEEIFNDNGGGDNWNEGWSDEENEKSQAQEMKPPTEGEEDVSAWGLDVDVEVEGDSQETSGPTTTDGGEADVGDAWDAWGWGDDGSAEPGPSPGRTKETGEVGNGVGGKMDREVTLKETYNITAVPEAILETIRKVIDDAETLTLPEYVISSREMFRIS
jgi:centromere/kinetochore protein ZW10